MRPLIPLIAVFFAANSAPPLFAEDPPKSELSRMLMEMKKEEVVLPGPTVSYTAPVDPKEKLAKDMFVRSVDALSSDDCIEVLYGWHHLVFTGKRPGETPDPAPGEGAAGERAKPFTKEMIKEAAKRIKARLKPAEGESDGDITVKLSPVSGASAAWGAVIFQGEVGGEMEIKSSAVETSFLGERRPRPIRALRAQEQLADSMLHETVHTFYSILTVEFGQKKKWKPARLTNRSPRRDGYWDGTPAEYDKPNQFSFSGTRYSEESWANEESARQVAFGCYRKTQGRVVGRVLGMR